MGFADFHLKMSVIHHILKQIEIYSIMNIGRGRGCLFCTSVHGLILTYGFDLKSLWIQGIDLSNAQKSKPQIHDNQIHISKILHNFSMNLIWKLCCYECLAKVDNILNLIAFVI